MLFFMPFYIQAPETYLGAGRRKPMQRMPILSDTDMSLFELKTRYVRNYLTLNIGTV